MFSQWMKNKMIGTYQVFIQKFAELLALSTTDRSDNTFLKVDNPRESYRECMVKGMGPSDDSRGRGRRLRHEGKDWMGDGEE